MPTVIDSFLVYFGFDTSGLEAGGNQAAGVQKRTRDDADKTAKQLEASGKRASLFFSQIRNQAVGLLAELAAANGLKNFAINVTKADVATGILAKNVKMSATELSAWEQAAQQVGGTAEGMAGTIAGLSNQVQAFHLTGTSPILGYLRAAGVDIGRFMDLSTPMGERLRLLSDAFRNLDPARASTLANMLGVDPGSLALLERTRGELDGMIDDAEKTAPSPEDIAAAQARNAELKKTEQALRAIGREVLTTLTPAFDHALERLDKFLGSDKFQNGLKKDLADIGTTLDSINFDKIGDDAEHFADGIQHIIDLLGGAKTASELLFALWAGSKVLSIFTGLAEMALLVSKAVGTPVAAATTLAEAGEAAGAAIAGTGAVPAIVVTGAAVGLSVAQEDARRRLHETHPEMDTAVNNSIIQGTLTGNYETQAPDETALLPTRNSESILSSLRRYTGIGGGGLTTYDDAQSDIGKFVAMGWTREQAAGIVANIAAESHGRETATGDFGAAYGLGQWHSDRRGDFYRQYGHSIYESTRDEQLAFINYELRNGKEQPAGAALSQARTASEAAAVVTTKYERPANADGKALERAQLANTIAGAAPVPDAGLTAAADPAVTAARGVISNYRASTSTSTSEVNIGEINIATRATDAGGIAAAIGPTLQRAALVQQANGQTALQ